MIGLRFDVLAPSRWWITTLAGKSFCVSLLRKFARASTYAVRQRPLTSPSLCTHGRHSYAYWRLWRAGAGEECRCRCDRMHLGLNIPLDMGLSYLVPEMPSFSQGVHSTDTHTRSTKIDQTFVLRSCMGFSNSEFERLVTRLDPWDMVSVS